MRTFLPQIVYVPGGGGSSALQGTTGRYVTVYRNAAATVVEVNLQLAAGSVPAPDGRVLVDASSRTPQLQVTGGDEVPTTLYAKPDGSTIITPIFSNAEELLARAEAAIENLGDSETLYVSPTGDDGNDGLLPSLAMATIAAALAALPSGRGHVIALPGTHDIAAQLVIDASKQRVTCSPGAILDASGLVGGSAVRVTSTATGAGASYTQKALGSVLFGGELLGPGIGSTVTGLEVSSEIGTEAAHLMIGPLVVHDFGVGIELGDGAHNVDFIVDVYNCGRCIQDIAAPTNAGERINFLSSTFFNSEMVGYFRNGVADYTFLSCAFDYNEQVFDTAGPVVTCTACHTEGNDANYGTNYPFRVGGGDLIYLGGVLTGALTTIPAYVNADGATGRTIFRDTRIYGVDTLPDFHHGPGSVVRTTAQTITAVGRVKSAVNRTAATGVVTTVPLGTAEFDTGGFFDAAQPNRIYAPAPGFYQVDVGLDMTNNANGQYRQVWAAVNGDDGQRVAYTNSAPSTYEIGIRASGMVYLAAGDYLELHVFHNADATLTINSPHNGASLTLRRVA